MNTPRFLRPIGFRPSVISAMVNREVIEQHAEEASFLWTQRDNATFAPNYSLNDLAGLDERIEANIDGLRIAGEIGWEICEEALDLKGPGEVFTAGGLALESKNKVRITKVLEIALSDPELTRAIVSALGWIAFNHVNGFIENSLASERGEIRRIGIAACAVRRIDPGPAIIKAILDQDAQLRARALKAAGELGRVNLLNVILPITSDPDESCHFFANWSAARLGDWSNSVLSALRQIAEAGGFYAERALDIALRCMELQQAKDWYQQLRNHPEHQRLAAIAAGVIGDPDLVKDLITLMAKEEFARVAGESISMITGVDLEYEELDGAAPEDFKSGPSEEPIDEDIEMDQDEDLPWPMPEFVSKWWQKHRRDFRPGVRYLAGKEISAESLKYSLSWGNQRQRTAAALELAIGEPNRSLFEVRAPWKHQVGSLNAWIS
jgi:uncharacterized protein (TIGR02270 family)